ncbi:hypothetical protein [Saccharopolyspora spinosa]|uniref:ROS/MUCR transcriptional regulator protein n=1 Tax=Saccharopolyspora spinosa TaxID=60894 RepID=A0A2N3Y161_SACSN|nr:hypothetical protein [Saccharopolyspora spinosa]PKW16623.1 hypothetical protein A8926_4472 [Saccharopolyspora spinosa]
MTPAHHAPIGSVVREGDLVQCHLCGRWFRSVIAHLRSHGWDHLSYRQAFGLERGESLEGTDTGRRRARAMRARRVLDPNVRAGSQLGQVWVRSGALTDAAAQAARGRKHPAQRRLKTLQALAAISPAARTEGTRRRCLEHLQKTAAAAAARLGFIDIGALVRDRRAAGASLAGISREAGLHKDWLSRHLATVDPDAAHAITDDAAQLRHDTRWLPVIHGLGFTDVRGYLTDRHLVRHHSVRAIAAEVGFSRSAVETALARHGLTKAPHATSRQRCVERAVGVANRFGFPDIDAYLADRRAAGLSWRTIAAECDQPPSWLRRRAGRST